jgi:hypothetical protein
MDFEEAPIVAGTNGPMIIVEPCCCPEEEEEVLDFLKTVDTDSEEDLEDGLNYLSRVKRDLNKFMDLVFFKLQQIINKSTQRHDISHFLVVMLKIVIMFVVL